MIVLNNGVHCPFVVWLNSPALLSSVCVGRFRTYLSNRFNRSVFSRLQNVFCICRLQWSCVRDQSWSELSDISDLCLLEGVWFYWSCTKSFELNKCWLFLRFISKSICCSDTHDSLSHRYVFIRYIQTSFSQNKNTENDPGTAQK